MIIDIKLSPEDNGEVEFLEKLTEAREHAINETDLSKSEIAAVMAQFSAGVATEADTGAEDDGLECPNCGGNVDNVSSMGMGMPPTVEPCGCEVEWSDLPPDLYLED